MQGQDTHTIDAGCSGAQGHFYHAGPYYSWCAGGYGL